MALELCNHVGVVDFFERVIAALSDRLLAQSFKRLDSPRHRLVEPAPELEIVTGVDGVVAIEIEEGFVGGGVVESAAEGQVVAGVHDGRENEPGSAVIQ